jgi:hypothetical protein
MKLWKVAILLVLALMMANCTVEKQEGLWLDSLVSCEEEDTPTEGQAFKVTGDGTFDVAVSWYYGANGSYSIRPLVRNKLMSSINEEFGNGEGNNIFLRRVEIDFEVPTDWDPIDRAIIPIGGALGPEDAKMFAINAIPTATRLQIEENFAKNAYKSAQPYSTLRPSGLDAGGNPIPCTNATAADDCFGYACVTDDSSDPTAKGTCATACTLSTGCARDCESVENEFVSLPTDVDQYDSAKLECRNVMDHPIYNCDIGSGDFGFCRQSCEAGINGCKNLRDPATGDVLVEYQCLRGSCIPAGTTVNPYDPDPVILKIRVIGQNPGGSWVGSNTLQFPLKICRGCLLDFNKSACNCSPLFEETVDCYEEANNISTLGEVCAGWLIKQDVTIQCAWLAGCARYLCPSLF